jgi:hypothetical protein
MKCNLPVRFSIVLLCVLAVTFAACSSSTRHQNTGDEVYEKLKSAQNERERIEIVKDIVENMERGGTREPLSGLAKYWMEYSDYLDTTPTLETLLSACLHKNDYHSAELERWLLDDLARSKNMDRRVLAWVFLSQTNWQFEEQRLLEAVESEKGMIAAGEYSNPLMLHSIGRIGQRLYPESQWWQPLIEPYYYDD